MPRGTMKAKVCLVGEAAVGKSSLIRRFVYDEFSDAYRTTLGVKVVGKDIRVETGEETIPLKMQLWDIMGEPTILDDLAESYFLNVQAIVAVCDLTRYSTFERLPVWLDAVTRVSGAIPVSIALNKADLRDDVTVRYEPLVDRFAKEIRARWYATSAKTGDHVEAMFSDLAADLVRSET